jgi:poly(hydroxyalkanoate) depolymerase family esterase
MSRSKNDTKRTIMRTRAKNHFIGRRRRTALCIWSALVALVASASSEALAAAPVEVTDFGSNPGNLRMFEYLPDGLRPSAPLVVVMHGCMQDATRFANETGWIQLADKFGFALALPQQTQANNVLSCFRWFDSNHNRRDQGEALSIKQMADEMKSAHNIDPKRVYVTGLSAGGAMTSVMLATYPDVFAGGGINAGLPYGCANSQLDAFQCMQNGQPGGLLVGLPGGLPGAATGSSNNSGPVSMPVSPAFCIMFPALPICSSSEISPILGTHRISPSEWGDFVRHASNFAGPFPKVSIWHGSADHTVSPVNETEETEQWTNVHGIDPQSAAHDVIKGFPHQTFKNANGDAVVEIFSITGMDHGQPVDPGTGGDQCGTPDQYIVNEHICASFFMAKFWGLAQ